MWVEVLGKGGVSVLRKLRNDSSDSVRRSVANSLNDIPKDNPRRVVELAQQWTGLDAETDALVKHAC